MDLGGLELGSQPSMSCRDNLDSGVGQQLLRAGVGRAHRRVSRYRHVMMRGHWQSKLLRSYDASTKQHMPDLACRCPAL
eukprot:365946-Chlamydomonas_euryale.AAC.11